MNDLADIEIHSIADAKKKWGNAAKKTKYSPRKKARKAREAKSIKAIDRRSLRATGRNKQFNFRAREGLKDQAQAAAKELEIPLSEWMEILIDIGLKKGIGILQEENNA